MSIIDTIGPCKKCGERNFITKQISAGGDSHYRIRCKTCGNTLVADSTETVISDWNTWDDVPQIPIDPNIPKSPDGKFQIYQVRVRHKSTYKIMYAVPSEFPSLVGYGDQLFFDLPEAIKCTEVYRKKYEDNERYKAEAEAQRKKQIEEQKKREDLHGFTDSMPPIQKGRVVKYMQKRYNFSAPYMVMTLKDFIEKVYLEKNVEMKIYEDKFNAQGDRRETPKKIYLVNHFEVGKTAYDYCEYLVKNKFNIEART